MEFANLYIAYITQIAEGGKVDTTLGQNVSQVAYTPDTRLLSSLDMGTAPAEPETETAPPADTSTNEEPKKKGCKAIFATPVAITALIACAFVYKKKKR